MLSRQEIIEKLEEILVSATDEDPSVLEGITEASKLSSDIGLSSVAILYMVIAIEETFDIRFDGAGVNDFETLGNVVDYIEGKLK